MDDVIGFFGVINPLSNFYEANFRVGTEEYISAEQYIQASKADTFKDFKRYERIMGSTNSMDCRDEA